MLVSANSFYSNLKGKPSFYQEFVLLSLFSLLQHFSMVPVIPHPATPSLCYKSRYEYFTFLQIHSHFAFSSVPSTLELENASTANFQFR